MDTLSSPSASGALAHLRRRWWATLGASGTVLVSGFCLLWVAWQPAYALRWGLTSLSLLLYGLWLLRRHLSDNHRLGEDLLLPDLGPGTVLTVARGVGLALLGGFVLMPRPPGEYAWIPVGLGTAAALADEIDGFLARLSGHSTGLGRALDTEFDALAMLVFSSLAVSYGQLPALFLVLGLARYVFVFGLACLKRAGRPVYSLPPSASRRLTAGTTLGFLTTALWPVLGPPMTTVAGAIAGGALVFSFVRDWLLATGCLRPESPQYVRLEQRVTDVLQGWVPLALRMVAFGAAVWVLLTTWILPAAVTATALVAPTLELVVTSTVVAGAAACVLFGVGGRFAGGALVVAAGFFIILEGPDSGCLTVLGSALALVLLGSGKLSLGRNDDRFFTRRLGDTSGVVE